jgi:hypothetical protein
MPSIKNQDLNLDAFLYSVTCSINKKINKYFNNILGDTNDIKSSLNNFLDFNTIKFHYKSHVFPCINGTILDITFKFMVGFNMQLIYDCFYVPRKK